MHFRGIAAGVREPQPSTNPCPGRRSAEVTHTQTAFSSFFGQRGLAGGIAADISAIRGRLTSCRPCRRPASRHGGDVFPQPVIAKRFSAMALNITRRRAASGAVSDADSMHGRFFESRGRPKLAPRKAGAVSDADSMHLRPSPRRRLAALGSPTAGVSLDGQDAVHTDGLVIHAATKPDGDANAPSPAGAPTLGPPRRSEPAPAARRRRARRVKSADAIDKTVLTFPEPRRIRALHPTAPILECIAAIAAGPLRFRNNCPQLVAGRNLMLIFTTDVPDYGQDRVTPFYQPFEQG